MRQIHFLTSFGFSSSSVALHQGERNGILMPLRHRSRVWKTLVRTEMETTPTTRSARRKHSVVFSGPYATQSC